MQFTEAPTAGGRVDSLEEIDQQLIKDIEEAWEYYTAPNSPGRKLDTEPFLATESMSAKDVAADWLRQARAYVRLRPEGRLVISGSPVKATAEVDADGALVVGEPAAGVTVTQVPAYKVRFILMEWTEGGDNGH